MIEYALLGVVGLTMAALSVGAVVDRRRLREGSRVTNDVRFVTYVRGEERYLFSWDGHLRSLARVFEAIALAANDPELAFDWDDAAECDRQVRRLERRVGGLE